MKRKKIKKTLTKQTFKKGLNQNKRGTVALDKTIILILIVISFAILLFFYSIFNWNPKIDKEACRESVILRGSLNAGIFQPGRETIPLKCETEKICMTMGSECSEFGKPSRLNKITTVKLSNSKAKAQEQVREVIAEALYDCHAILGEGWLNFMPHKSQKERYCLMCSRLALDDRAKQVIDDITYIDLYAYMKQKKTSGGSNFLKLTYDVERVNDMIYLLEEARNIYNQKVREEKEKDPEFPLEEIYDVREIKIDMQIENAIIAQISPATTQRAWVISLGVGAAVAGIMLAPVSFGGSLTITGAGIAALAGATTTGVVLVKTFPGGEKEYLHPTIYPYNLEGLKAIKCTSFETAP